MVGPLRPRNVSDGTWVTPSCSRDMFRGADRERREVGGWMAKAQIEFHFGHDLRGFGARGVSLDFGRKEPEHRVQRRIYASSIPVLPSSQIHSPGASPKRPRRVGSEVSSQTRKARVPVEGAPGGAAWPGATMGQQSGLFSVFISRSSGRLAERIHDR